MMHVNRDAYPQLVQLTQQQHVTLVAVSKTKPVAAIQELYDLGQRDFGENYVQELVAKQPQLPADIRWHFIGHLQTNKVKYIAPFVHLIHGVDSWKLLAEIDKQARRNQRTIDVLLQVHIAREETKFGLDAAELQQLLQQWQQQPLPQVRIQGLMGMASFSNDENLIRSEFRMLKQLFDTYKNMHPNWDILSMGMSGDYTIALQEGSNLLRIGSLLFGARN
ncbi:MAG: YggS family pyridoxal phosphate-dependent enzyme [Lacibacter sp.]